MTRRFRCIAALCGVAACLLACSVAGATAVSSLVPLEKLLPKVGEIPGFGAYGLVHLTTTISGDVAVDPAALKESDAENLRKDGYRGSLYQSQVGAGKSGGVAGVTEFSSPAGAVDYEKFTFGVIAQPGPVFGSSAVMRFVQVKIPGVPGAEGAAEVFRKITRSTVNLEWVEGSCLVQLGYAVPSRTPVTAPLVQGAQAIYKRTKGAC